MDVTPRRAASTAATQMQLVLRSASLHPPPTTSLDAAVASSGAGAGACGSGGTASVVACDLMAVSEGLYLAMLCRSNTIRAVSLLDVPDAAAAARAPSSSSRTRTPQQQRQRGEEDPFNTVSFSADCAPRPGDDVIPSDSIPPKTPIKGLEFSPSGHSLLIWGESYVAVARLPRGSGSGSGNSRGNINGVGSPTPNKQNGDGSSSDKSARWKWTLVDMSGYTVDVMRQRIVQASWHPASDSCVTLLTVGKDDVYVAVAQAGAKAFVMLHVPGRERPEKVRDLRRACVRACSSLKGDGKQKIMPPNLVTVCVSHMTSHCCCLYFRKSSTFDRPTFIAVPKADIKASTHGRP